MPAKSPRKRSIVKRRSGAKPKRSVVKRRSPKRSIVKRRSPKPAGAKPKRSIVKRRSPKPAGAKPKRSIVKRRSPKPAGTKPKRSAVKRRSMYKMDPVSKWKEGVLSEQETVEEWKKAKTYKDLLYLGKRFLRGELQRSPFHLGPIMEETIPLVGGLVELHNRGILTLEGQPREMTFNLPIKIKRGKKTVFDSAIQKPYLVFIMDNSRVNKLKDYINVLNRQEGKTIYCFEVNPYGRPELFDSNKDGKTVLTQVIESDSPVDPSDMEDLWEPHTFAQNEYRDDDFLLIKENCPDISEDELRNKSIVELFTDSYSDSYLTPEELLDKFTTIHGF